MGSPRGAKAAAILYSLLQTCKLHAIEPYAYFKHVLTHMPTLHSDEEIKSLLPQFITRDHLIKAYQITT